MSIFAALRDVLMESLREEFASHMGQWSSDVVSRDVPIMVKREAFVSRMALGRKDVALRAVPTKSSREEFVGRMVQMGRWSNKGCTNGSVKGGVCVTHGAKSKQCSVEGCAKRARRKIGVCQRHRSNGGINSNNNTTLQPNIVNIPAVSPFQ
jgi:hypothetical protein